MQSVINQLYRSFCRLPDFEEEQRRLDGNEVKLKQGFSKFQRRLLLAIIDDKDLICEKTSRHSFKVGFVLGFRLGTEIIKYGSGIFDELSELSDMPLNYYGEENVDEK